MDINENVPEELKTIQQKYVNGQSQTLTAEEKEIWNAYWNEKAGLKPKNTKATADKVETDQPSKTETEKTEVDNSTTAPKTPLTIEEVITSATKIVAKIDEKAASVFDPEYIKKLGKDMPARYQDIQARYEALKAVISNPSSEQAERFFSKVTPEQIQARFEQFEKQFEILEKTKSLKTYFAAKSGGKDIFSKNVAFAKFKFTTQGSRNNPNNPPKSYELDLIAISGNNGEKFMRAAFGEPVEIFTYGSGKKVKAYKYNDFYVLEDIEALKKQAKDETNWDAGLESEDPSILKNNGADSERKMTIFADAVVNNASDKSKASIVIETEMSPCDRCSNVVKNLAEKNKDLLDSKVEFGVYFKQPVSVNDRTLGNQDSKFMTENPDITDFLIKK
jgi:hypothetical protein